MLFRSVPTIARWPDRIPAGRVHDGLLSQIDFYATIAAIVGAELPTGEAEDSIDQLAMFENRASARTELVHNTNPNGYAIRAENWVLIEARTGGVSKVPEWFDKEFGYPKNADAGELYDLKSDLAQRNNLYSANEAKVKEMQERLQRIRSRPDR